MSTETLNTGQLKEIEFEYENQIEVTYHFIRERIFLVKVDICFWSLVCLAPVHSAVMCIIFIFEISSKYSLS